MSSIKRWGARIATGAISFIFLGKLLRWFLDLIGWSTAPEDFMALLDKLDQMPWYAVVVLLFAAWFFYFAGPPSWSWLSENPAKLNSPNITDPAFDIKGRDALLYAIHRKWPLPPRGSEIDLKEVELVFDVLDRFYDLAGNDLLKVWGRANGVSYRIKPVPMDHWENFEIRYADVIGDDSEPLRTVLKQRSYATGPYFADLHLNRDEVLHFWPMEDEKS